jgi:hypothetical protein
MRCFVQRRGERRTVQTRWTASTRLQFPFKLGFGEEHPHDVGDGREMKLKNEGNVCASPRGERRRGARASPPAAAPSGAPVGGPRRAAPAMPSCASAREFAFRCPRTLPRLHARRAPPPTLRYSESCRIQSCFRCGETARDSPRGAPPKASGGRPRGALLLGCRIAPHPFSARQRVVSIQSSGAMLKSRCHFLRQNLNANWQLSSEP